MKVAESEQGIDTDPCSVNKDNIANKDENKGENEQDNSDDNWYWDDDLGWVQYNEQQFKSEVNDSEHVQNEEANETDWYWDDDRGWVEDAKKQNGYGSQQKENTDYNDETIEKESKRIDDIRKDRQFELMQEIEAMEVNDWGRITSNHPNTYLFKTKDN